MLTEGVAIAEHLSFVIFAKFSYKYLTSNSYVQKGKIWKKCTQTHLETC